MISGGIWFSASYQESSSSTNTVAVRYTVIKAGDIESDSEELRLRSTQIKAYNAHFNTKKLDIAASHNEYHHKAQGGGINIQVARTGNTGSNAGGNTGKMSADEVVPLNAHIHVTENLVLKVDGHASIRGASITAKSLEASFESLLLESLQSVQKNEGYSFGLSIGWGSTPSTGGSFELSKGNKNMVTELTELIGHERAVVVVAHALQLNGAMIANAQKDEDGKYTDLGHLTLTVGELFVKHIYDSDKGHTLGASVNLAKSDKNVGMNKYGVVFAGRHGDGYTFGTIGKGDFKCTEDGGVCEITKANRDVSTPSSFDYAYNIKEIRAKWSQIDDKTKEKALENLKSGKFIENTINDFTNALGDVKDAIKSITPDFLWPKDSEAFEEPEIYEEEIGEVEEKVDKDNKPAQKDKKDSSAQKDRKTQSQKLKEQKEIAAIDEDALRLHPELAEDHGKRVLVAYTAREIENNGLALDRQGAVEAAYMLVDSYDGKAVKVHKASYAKIAHIGVREAIKGCASNPSCNKYVIEGLTAISAMMAGYLAKKIKTTFDDDKAEEQSALENTKKSDYNKRTGVPKATQVEAASTPPEDFDPDEDRPHWKVKKYDRVEYSDRYGAKYYRDPKATSENGNKLWWTKDNAGHSGAATNKSPSTWKVYEQTKDGLRWYKDVDKYGQYIEGKHKGDVGKLIEWKDLRGVHDPKITSGK
jgi:hypothetical protein